MRLLNAADGLDDFPEFGQFLAVASNGHSGDLQQISERFVGCGPLLIDQVEDNRRTVPCAPGRRHSFMDIVI